MKKLLFVIVLFSILSCTDERYVFDTYKLTVVRENELFKNTVLVNVISKDTVYFPYNYLKSLINYKDLNSYYFYFLHYTDGDYYRFLKVELKTSNK